MNDGLCFTTSYFKGDLIEMHTYTLEKVLSASRDSMICECRDPEAEMQLSEI